VTSYSGRKISLLVAWFSHIYITYYVIIFPIYHETVFTSMIIDISEECLGLGINY